MKYINLFLGVTFLVILVILYQKSRINPIYAVITVTFISGLFVSKYRYFVLFAMIFMTVMLIVNFHVKKIMGFYFFEILPDLFAISLDSNIDELIATLKNINSKYEILTVLGLLVFLMIFFSYRKIKFKTLFIKKIFLLSACSFFVLCISPGFMFQQLFQGIKDTYCLYQDNKLRIIERERFSWGAVSGYSGKDTVVLILGETTRGDKLGINGYSRNTTPYLSQFDLISYSDVISNAAYTLLSTPIILTRSRGEVKSRVFGEKSLISAFKEAGYKTYYLSYLNKVHIGDNAINLLVSEADEYIKGVDHIDELTDIGNAKDVISLINNAEEKKLIIFKLIGSHYNFHDRFDQRFNQFKPSHLDVSYAGPKLEEKHILNNSYDNSILVTDYVVASILDELEKLEGRASLSFISDHGISIFDNKDSAYGGPTPANYNIPMFFWFNKFFTQEEKITNLSLNRDKKVDTTCFLDTFYSLHDIETSKRKGCDLTMGILGDYSRQVIIKNELVDFDDYFY